MLVPALGVDDAVQVQGWRFCRGLTQHDMDLPSMVRLMIKQVGAGYMRCFHIVLALIVRVCEGAGPESDIEMCEERLDSRVLSYSRASQTGEVIIQDLV